MRLPVGLVNSGVVVVIPGYSHGTSLNNSLVSSQLVIPGINNTGGAEVLRAYRCHFCSFSTSAVRALEAHSLSHEGSASAMCPWCGFTSPSEGDVKRHLLGNCQSHIGEPSTPIGDNGRLKGTLGDCTDHPNALRLNVTLQTTGGLIQDS